MYKWSNLSIFLGTVVLCALSLSGCDNAITVTGTTIKNFKVDITDPADPAKKVTYEGIVDKSKYTIDIVVDKTSTTNYPVYKAARDKADIDLTFLLAPTFEQSQNSKVTPASGATVDFFTHKYSYKITSGTGKAQTYVAYLGTAEEIQDAKDKDEISKYITGNRITNFQVYVPWALLASNTPVWLSDGQRFEDFFPFKGIAEKANASASETAMAENIKAWAIVAFVDDGEGSDYAKLFQAAKANNQKAMDEATKAGKTAAEVEALRKSDAVLKMELVNQLSTEFDIPENASVNPFPGTKQNLYVQSTSAESKPEAPTSRYEIRADEEATDTPITTNETIVTWTRYGVPYTVTSQTGDSLEYRVWIILYSDAADWQGSTLPPDDPEKGGMSWGWEYR
jgi:hypothetical protein